MVMLTSSQVSLAASSVIVVSFTFLLFLTGYIFQQQTVREIQEAIKPRLPRSAEPAALEEPENPNSRLARVLGARNDRHSQYMGDSQIDWKRLGYVQMVTEHRDVCTAVMQFAELHREKSPAARLLMFPRSWVEDDDDDAGAEGRDPYLDTSRRLLRAAGRRYRVILRPVDPLLTGGVASRYSLASIFSLAEYDRLLYLAPPGIVIDSLALDALLAFSRFHRMAALPDDPAASRISTKLMLMQPSPATFGELSSAIAKHVVEDDVLFQRFFDVSTCLLLPTARETVTLYYESSALRALGDPRSFNSTQFLHSTAYLRLADPELPGPEYDVPHDRIAQLRPAEDEPRRFWEKLYSRFRASRMDVCGLDLLVAPAKSKDTQSTA